MLKPLGDDERVGVRRGCLWRLGVFFRRGGRYEVWYRDGRVWVAALGSGSSPVQWEWSLQVGRVTRDFLESKETIMSKYIARAVKAKGGPSTIGPGSDDAFFTNRPAIYEYMTDCLGPTGKGRETSCMMIASSESGVRAGLKDDDAGGWVWREGMTVDEAVDSVEKVLASGTAVFRAPGGRGKRPGKRG
jgi:hypothetical protein